jgi:hypothetical protein
MTQRRSDFTRPLRKRAGSDTIGTMKSTGEKPDRAWRKSRLAARLLIRKEVGKLRPRDQNLALRLSQDPEVSDRLIQQALYYLGIGPRKHAFDQKLVDGRN